jgi:hypothetical protein
MQGKIVYSHQSLLDCQVHWLHLYILGDQQLLGISAVNLQLAPRFCLEVMILSKLLVHASKSMNYIDGLVEENGIIQWK